MLLLPVALALCGIVPESFAQTQPSAAPTPKAMLVDGQPALGLDYGDGTGFLIVYTTWHDEPALRFSVEFDQSWSARRICRGYLWISNSRIGWEPDTPKCRPDKHDILGEFDVPRSALRMDFTNRYGLGISFYVGSKRMDDAVIPTYLLRPRDEDQAAAPSAAATKALKPLFQLALTDFAEAEKRFQKATPGLALPLTTAQANLASAAVKDGAAAEQTGNLQAAFNTYVSALANLPANVTGDQVDLLRDHLLRLIPKLNPVPAVPEDAKRHLAFALAAIADWKSSGDVNKLTEADDELNRVARLAPWRPEVYYNLGIVLEAQNQYAAAARNLKLYLLAAPNASDADTVQQQIYQLEYKTGAR